MTQMKTLLTQGGTTDDLVQMVKPWKIPGKSLKQTYPNVFQEYEKWMKKIHNLSDAEMNTVIH